MDFIKLAQKNREINPKSWQRLYEQKVVSLVREKYTVNQELAILRQKDEKREEFEEYNSFVEWCKRFVKKEMGYDS